MHQSLKWGSIRGQRVAKGLRVGKTPSVRVKVSRKAGVWEERNREAFEVLAWLPDPAVCPFMENCHSRGLDHRDLIKENFHSTSADHRDPA